MPEVVAREPIAIIGLGCVLPDAPDVETFWNNLLAGKNSIREVPKERWDPALFYSPNKDEPDRTYAKIGAFVAEDNFNGLDYRMPPKSVEQIDPSQRWALSATRQALQDAGYKTGLKSDEPKGGRDFDRSRCGVILGNAMGGEQMKLQTKNLYWPQVEAALRSDPDFGTIPKEKQAALLGRAKATFQRGVPVVTEDSMPGSLSNVAAGRIANVFDLHGKNFTTDAACASSLAAMDAAVDSLRRKECDLVVCGGTDRSMDVTPYVEFSKIGALSPDGSRPFDKDANGFVMGEGCAILLMKRLSDAERDGDKIYAVIRGLGSSSDGKGKGITAPNPVGQVKAVQRAYADAAVDPASLGYLEAHGTSTPVGDPVELTSAEEAFRTFTDRLRVGQIFVGSVKSNMGHLKSAAGAVGLLKAALAIHRGVIPPSINVRELNPRIDWKNSPFKVVTTKTPWPAGPTPRRAAVSSFGFGGTNFHIVVEEYRKGALLVAPTQKEPQTADAAPTLAAHQAVDAGALTAYMAGRADIEGEAVVLAANDESGLMTTVASLATPSFTTTGSGPRLRDVLHPVTVKGLAAPARFATALTSLDELPKKLELAKKAASNPAAARLAFAQGVFINQGAPQGKVAFLFPGQGTQYVNMLRDLQEKYEVVRNTFHEADEVLIDELDGVKLTDILWPNPDTPEARAAAEAKLKLTEFTQPAVLAADVALLRLLKQWGIKPDVVAGHSLGEYGALVAAGVLSFADALHAVAARGREMAHVDVPDLGKMAAVPADWHTVEDALKHVEGYVIPANKNCPSQTVLAGSSEGVDAAVAALKDRGLDAQYLPVSAAFHSDIVAPASGPLRKVLSRLDVQGPKVRVLSNVGAEPYPEEPEAIRDNLAVQVASPVEWIGIIERMYDEGVRTFIEVGPKRALTGFVLDILKDKDAVAICANHPKKGGIAHVNELFAFLGAWGFRPTLPALDDPAVYTLGHRDPAAPFRGQATSAPSPPPAAPSTSTDPTSDSLRRLADALREHLERPAPTPPAVAAPAPSTSDLEARLKAFGFSVDDIGISGISIGLPGTKHALFAADNWDRILAGENLIDQLPENERVKIAEKNIRRLVKGGDGSAQFQVVTDIAQVIQLAGRRGGFDVAEWGVDEELAETLDRTFQYAIAAGLEALHDAGIPMQRTYMTTSTGSQLPKAWKLPAPMQDETGIIFASAFPAYDNLLRDVSRFLADKYAGKTLDDLQSLYEELVQSIQDESLRSNVESWFEGEFKRLQEALPGHGTSRYEFNRKFLFHVLSMGHAQLAQWIGARGPNTQINAACASTTQAVAMAEDWIRMGRCRRVLVVGADDVTSDAMFEWIGAGFLASGAATTKADVKEAALPFDKRRHGMIVGMGAVGMVIEAVPEVEARGMRPIARLLSTRIANSAFHGSRLDVEHIAAEMTELVRQAGRRYGIDATSIAEKTVFMSHETYTPARGGSASAEIHALRAAFGAKANRVVIANTKGFTGHPQGAGIEDAIVLKCLQRGKVPPIANFREPDPELGDLRLSPGGAVDVRYALRLAAGFGSQVAMSLTELVAREEERLADKDRYEEWLARVSGITGAKTEVQNRTLRIVDVGPQKAEAKSETAPKPAPTPAAPKPAPLPAPVPTPHAAAPKKPGAPAAVLERLIALVAEKTGYPTDLLDPALDMEADLGIDTVKQAELFGAIRESYDLPQEEGIQLKDYNTLEKVAGYVQSRLTGAAAPATPAPAQPTQAQAAPEAASPAVQAAPSAGEGEILAKIVDLVAAQTGYPKEMLEPDLDMEADLGIDTVKQAELFGAVRELYAIPLEEGLQIKDYPTLRKVAGYFAGRVGATGSTTKPPAASSPAQPTTPSPAPAKEAGPKQGGANAADVLAKITELVAAQTGYPPDMLEPDLDMEADLGIDTVKQAELFGAVREHYAIPLEEGLQIKDYPTLRKVAGYFTDRMGKADAATAPATPTEREVGASTAQATATPTPSKPSPAGPSEADVLAKITELVAAQTGYPPDMLEPDLDMEADLGIDTVKQAELFGAVREHYAIPLEEGLQIKDYPTLRKVAGYFAGRVGEGGAHETPPPATSAPAPSTGILRRIPQLRPAAADTPNALASGPVLVVGDHDDAITTAFVDAGFACMRDADRPVGILALATRDGHDPLERVLPLFLAAKQHKDSLAFVCVVTRQDGAHGLRHVRDASMSAVAGLGKALRKELGCLVKVIDVDPADDHAGKHVVDEMRNGGPRTEVCFDASGERFVVEVAPQTLAGSAPDVTGKGIVVSGGAQGITVELLAALAPQGPNLLLLGRTDQPEDVATWAAWDDAAWKEEEQRTISALREAGGKVTPVAIQKAMAPKQKAAEVFRNLKRLQDAGATVLYAPVDVTDRDAVAEAIAWAREQWGGIHGVIHAAGLEISKDITSKDEGQFSMVFAVKAKGFQALMDATRSDRLDFIMGFGSIAGRFGNLGQTDYSAANEYLAKAVKEEARRRKTPTACTIAWGPWGEVGMATRGSIMQVMHASGVTPIPTAEGTAFFLGELGTPGIRESVVAGAVGAIDIDEQVVETGWSLELEVARDLVARHPDRFRLLSEIIEIEADKRVVASVRMDQAIHPFAKDHRVDGVPYLPGVFGLEAFAEAASLLAPDEYGLVAMENVQFDSPLKQLKTAAEAIVTATVDEDSTAGTTTIDCTLTSRFVAPDGRVYGEPRRHFRARLVFGGAMRPATSDVPAVDGTWQKDDIYPPFFHGPSFQVLAEAGPLDEPVARFHDARGQFDGATSYTAAPMLIEALFQVCGLRTLAKEQKMSLPAAIERVEFFSHQADARLRGHPTGTDQSGNRRFDAEAIGADGTVLVRIRGFSMIETGPATVKGPTRAAGENKQTAPVSMPAKGRAAKEPVAFVAGIPDAGIALPESDEVHFAAVRVEDTEAEEDWFTVEERTKFAEFKAPKRAHEWRAGRLAAKKAVVETHDGAKPSDVVIEADARTGRPKVFIGGKETALWVSITHRDGLALAAVSPGPVGIDLETVEDRPRSFLEEAFSVEELKALMATEDPRFDVACMWAAKEAALKRAGVGLQSDLRAHEVSADGGGGAVVTGPTGRFGIRFFDVEGRVLALSAPHLDPDLKAHATQG